MIKGRGLAALAALLFAVFAGAGAAFATGQPEPWQMGFQKAATPLMERLDDFHDLLLIIVVLVTAFVLALMLWAMIRYRQGRNPNPSNVTHNTLVEVVWTVVPILILVVIAVPSFRLLYYSDRAPALTEAQKQAGEKILTFKAIGHQWYWSYEFAGPTGGRFRFESRLLCRTAGDCEKASKTAGRKVLRLLDTDNAILLPAGATVRVQVTAADVIHSWTIPSSGAKVDAVPGRLNEVWVRFNKPGWYYGQCSELCGRDHAYMPISIKVVTAVEYRQWLEASWKKAEAEEQNFSIVEEPKKTSMIETDTIKR